MFISEKNKKATLRTMFIYIGLTLLTALFGGIYEIFSHNVYSANMVFAWAWLLGFGVLMYLALALLPISKVPGILLSSIYNFGVAMITARSIYIGVVDIYGTNRADMITVYTIIALIFLIAGFLGYLAVIVYNFIKKKEETKE